MPIDQLPGTAIAANTITTTQLTPDIANVVTANVISVANTAYGQANSAYAQANTAYGQANSAYGGANTAYAQANAAYAQANTKPSLGLVIALS
jgi:hypothetical protein